jgi:hypothetical protein
MASPVVERSRRTRVRHISQAIFCRSPHTGRQPQAAQTDEETIDDADRTRKRWKPECKPDREQHTGPSGQATISPDGSCKIDDTDSEEE